MDSIVVPPSCELPLWRSQDGAGRTLHARCSTTRARSAGGLGSATGSTGRRASASRAANCSPPYFTDPLASLLDYLRPGDLIVVDEPEAVRLADRRTGARRRGTLHRVREHRANSPPACAAPYIPWDDLAPRLTRSALAIGALDMRTGRRPPIPKRASAPLPLPEFEPPQPLHRQHRARPSTMCARCWPTGSAWSSSASRPQRLRELFEEADIYPTRRKLPPSRALSAAPRGGRRRGSPQPRLKPQRPLDPRPKSRSGLIETAARPARAGGVASAAGRRWTRAGAASRC